MRVSKTLKYDVPGEILYIWVAKVLMSSSIFYKTFEFSIKSAWHKKYSIHRAQIPWDLQLCCALSIFKTDISVA